MNTELLDSLEQKHKQVKELDTKSGKINLDLEDSMLDDFNKLFKLEFSAEVEDSSYREHGWYYVHFVLNNLRGSFCYHPLTNKADIMWHGKYIAKDDAGIEIEKLFSIFHKVLNNET